LQRARQTAERIAKKHGLPVICDPAFRERCAGEWEGLTVEEVKEKYPDWEQASVNGGWYGIESTEQMRIRFLKKCDELVQKHLGGRILIVAHGMCINVAVAALTGGEYGYPKEKLHNTSITQFTYNPRQGWLLRKYNEVPHL
jgi:broad specificity phosphatase PhoE